MKDRERDELPLGYGILEKHERSFYLDIIVTPATARGVMPQKKGDVTRRTILEEALQLASVVGLDGLTIGTLAKKLELSKSGLFRHFGSKEALQKAVVETGAEHFIQLVVRPVTIMDAGADAMRALFDGWLEWSVERMAGGCLFVTAAVEFDDRPGPVRDQIVALQREWLGFIAATAGRAVESGDFRPDLDVRQFAFDFNAILLGFNQVRRLLQAPDAEPWARRAFERLLADAHTVEP